MLYDCFTFFNELELLDIRLHTLHDIVDKFVIVEATKTYQNSPKILYFDKNKSLFRKFENKIIHVVVDDFPQEINSWAYEHHQRNSIIRGLSECSNNDIVMISDVDEIPHPHAISRALNLKGIRIFVQNMYYYYLNCINITQKNWCGTVMLNYSEINKPLQAYRDLRRDLSGQYFHLNPAKRLIWRLFLLPRNLLQGISFISDGGWHFSYLGGIERIIQKIESFAHTEYNKNQYKDCEYLKQCITNGKDIFGRGFCYKFVPIDSSFPEYIINNSHLLSDLIGNC